MGPEEFISYEEQCASLRTRLGKMERELRGMMEHFRCNGEDAYPRQTSEMKAQTMLAVRHIEDARMRVGKMLQYADDGVSILDKLEK